MKGKIKKGKTIRAGIGTWKLKIVSAKPYLSVEAALPSYLSFLFLGSSCTWGACEGLREAVASQQIAGSPQNLPTCLSWFLEQTPGPASTAKYQVWPKGRCSTHPKNWKGLWTFINSILENVFGNESYRYWVRVERNKLDWAKFWFSVLT